MVQVDAAVGVDVNQRACLIEEAGGKGNAEFDRRQHQPFFQDRASGIERANGFAALGILAALLEVGGHLFQQVVLDRLVIVRDVTLGLAVIVGLAHRQRVLAEETCDAVHDLFDGDHALRAAKATVGRVGRGVSLAAMAVDRGFAQIVGVVGVKHGAVDNRRGQVRRVAAVACQIQLYTLQTTLVVEAHVVLDVERVALAGHLHVFKTLQAHLGGLAGQPCNHGAQAGRARRLGFLAAKATTHAPHVDHDAVHRHAQYLGHQLLDFRGVLGRAIDNHAAVFSRHHRGYLGFQIKMFLTADVQVALQTVGCACQRCGRVATFVRVAVEHKVFLTQRLNHIQHRLQVLIFDNRRHCRLPGNVQIASSNGKHRLTDKLHRVDGQQRIAGQQRPDVLQPRNILMSNRNAYAVEGVAGRGVDADDSRVGTVGKTCIHMQLIGKLQAIIDIHRFAGHMFVGAVMLDAATDASAQALLKHGEHFGLGNGWRMLRHSQSPALRRQASALR